MSLQEYALICHINMAEKKRGRGLSFSKLFGKKDTYEIGKEEAKDTHMEISAPTNVTHDVHVEYDKETQNYIGLPQSWDIQSNDMKISDPMNVKHQFHVEFNPATGTFSGLPKTWEALLKQANIRYVALINIMSSQTIMNVLNFLLAVITYRQV